MAGLCCVFYSHDIPLLRIMTDRGAEYCGKIENHENRLYPAIEDFDYINIKAKSLQASGICEQFHKTVLHEFGMIGFRKKVYKSLDELQGDIDIWIKHYNEERPHTGKYCYGKTPVETFIDSKHIAKEKQLDFIFQKSSENNFIG